LTNGRKEIPRHKGFVIVDAGIEMKEKWQNFIDKNDKFSNLTTLIKYCVNGYIGGDLIDTVSNNNMDTDLRARLSELEQMINDMTKEREELFILLKNLNAKFTKGKNIEEIIDINS